MKRFKKSVVSLLLVFTMLISMTAFSSVASAASKVPTEKEAYNRIIALKKKYPHGKKWTNSNFARFNGGYYAGGYGCAGFAFICSDAAFGKLPARFITSKININTVHVGDILRINGDTHRVVVLKKKANSIVICEGNIVVYPSKTGSIYWGRELSAKEVAKANYVITRYPKGYFASKTVATTSLTVPKKAVTVKVGKKYTIKPTVKPAKSTQKVTYSTSNKKVATVSASGVIKGIKKGTAKITVKSGKKSVIVKVTVK